MLYISFLFLAPLLACITRALVNAFGRIVFFAKDQTMEFETMKTEHEVLCILVNWWHVMNRDLQRNRLDFCGFFFIFFFLECIFYEEFPGWSLFRVFLGSTIRMEAYAFLTVSFSNENGLKSITAKVNAGNFRWKNASHHLYQPYRASLSVSEAFCM